MVAIGEEAVFRCLHSTAPLIVWNWNGTLVRESNPPPGITPGRTLDENGNVILYTLNVTAHSNYNQTEVVCVAVFIDGQIPDDETTPVSLLIQGEVDGCT